MNSGRSVFAQLIEHLPLHQFRQCVARYGGDHRVHSFSCYDQLLCMVFAQLTGRESLRDLVACLRALGPQLYHQGIRGIVSRSTLADANEKRDWRIYADLAQVLIAEARRLYVDDDIGLDLDQTIYALDSTTIDLCMSLFPWALYKSDQHAVKLHTLLDVRGSIPTFISITPAQLHDVNILDELAIQPGAIYVMDRGYLDFQRLHRITQAGAFFVTRAKKNFRFRRLRSRPVDEGSGILCDQTIVPRWFYTAKRYPQPLRRVRYRDAEQQRTLTSDQPLQAAGPGGRPCVPPALARGTVLQVDQAALTDQGVLRHLGQRAEDPGMDRDDRLPAGGNYAKEAEHRLGPAHSVADHQRHDPRENAAFSGVFANRGACRGG